jgi:hypothetical protein
MASRSTRGRRRSKRSERPSPAERSASPRPRPTESSRPPGRTCSSSCARLSRGLQLPDRPGARERQLERRLAVLLERVVPERHRRASDRIDVRALALALPRCRLATCDAFMADVVRRSGLHVRFRCELYTGRRADVDRLRERLEQL